MRYFWLGGHDEPAVADALASLAEAGSAALDIGAHVGIETVLLADRVGSGGLVVSVEPDPRNAGLLRKSCQLNELANVRVVEAVASDTSGHVTFMLEDDSTMSHIGLTVPSSKTASSGDSVEKQPLTLPSVTVDQIVEEICSPLPVSVIKIDVEGHEVSVLKGAQKLLAGGSVSVVVEIHTDAALRQCIELLRSYDLRLKTLGNNDYFEAILSGSTGEGAEFVRGHLVANTR
jgi:FkbM family methyltransferase